LRAIDLLIKVSEEVFLADYLMFRCVLLCTKSLWLASFWWVGWCLIARLQTLIGFSFLFFVFSNQIITIE